MADYSWIKPVGEFIVNLWGNISKSNKEKKAKRQAENMEQSNEIPAGYYLGVDGVLYPNNNAPQTKQDIERKQARFGGSVDWKLYENAGKDDAGNDLFRIKVRAAAAPGSSSSKSNIVGGIIDAVGGIFNPGSDNSGNPKPMNNIVSQVFKPVNLILIGGAGYGIWYYFSKAKKPVR